MLKVVNIGIGVKYYMNVKSSFIVLYLPKKDFH